MNIIDLRSDTVTLPSAAMKEAMMNARLGDDVFGEDPTTIELEQYAAALFNKEAALFCPSGTMTNQIGIKLHTQPGDEVICHRFSHVYNYEGGGASVNSGVSMWLLDGDKGKFTAKDVEMAIHNPEDPHYPISKLVVIENTANRAGGTVWTIDEILPIQKICKEKGLKLHLDGARLFNALEVTNNKPLEYGALFDTISICLSKGLGAPTGSLLIGSYNDIIKARRIRKYLGGGMRQSGMLAAAGLYALQNNVKRLDTDHKRAAQIGKCLEKLPFVNKVYPVETNIVIFELKDSYPAQDFVADMGKRGIRLVRFSGQTVRIVTHLDLSDSMIIKLIETLNEFAK